MVGGKGPPIPFRDPKCAVGLIPDSWPRGADPRLRMGELVGGALGPIPVWGRMASGWDC